MGVDTIARAIADAGQVEGSTGSEREGRGRFGSTDGKDRRVDGRRAAAGNDQAG